MASSIESYVGHTVSVITADGRNIVGTLKGYDQTINIILDESHERVYSQNAGVEQVNIVILICKDNVSLYTNIHLITMHSTYITMYVYVFSHLIYSPRWFLHIFSGRLLIG